MPFGPAAKTALGVLHLSIAFGATPGCVAPNPAFDPPTPQAETSEPPQGRLISGTGGMIGKGGQMAAPGLGGSGGAPISVSPQDGAPIARVIDASVPWDTSVSPVCPAWWKREFVRRLSLPVSGGARGLPAGSFVAHSFDHAAWVARMQSKPDGRDLHMGIWNGTTWTEIPFFVDERSKWNAPTTTLWWRLPAAVAPGAKAVNHYLFFGDPVAPAVVAKKPNAVLSRVQTGSLTIKSDAVAGTSVVPVDPTRSFVIFQTRHAGARPVDSAIRARLNDTGTAVEFTRLTDSNVTVTVDVRFYVLEFANGVRVQHGVIKQSGLSTPIALNPPVAVDRTFALWSKTPDPSNTAFNSDDPLVAWIKDPRTLELQGTGAVGTQFAVAWQVVEFTNAEDMAVARNLTRIQGGQVETVVQLPRAYDLTRSFVLADFLSASPGRAGVGGQLITVRPASPTSLVFQRGAPASFDVPRIGWQVMELGKSARVEAGSLSYAPGEAVKRVKLARTPVPEFSVAFSSVQSGGGQNTGATPYTADDVVGVCAVTMAFEGGNLVVERSSVVDRCTVYHQVAEWPESFVSTDLGKIEGPGCN